MTGVKFRSPYTTRRSILSWCSMFSGVPWFGPHDVERCHALGIIYVWSLQKLHMRKKKRGQKLFSDKMAHLKYSYYNPSKLTHFHRYFDKDNPLSIDNKYSEFLSIYLIKVFNNILVQVAPQFFYHVQMSEDFSREIFLVNTFIS